METQTQTHRMGLNANVRCEHTFRIGIYYGTLPHLFIYFVKKYSINFESSPMGKGPTSQELPNQLVLQTGHQVQEPKLYPDHSKCNTWLQVDLLLRPANSTSLVPTWHGAPSQVDHTLNRSTSTAPLNNLQNSSQRLHLRHKILAQHSQRVIPPT